MKLLDLIETYRAEDADPNVLFRGTGQRVRGAARNSAAMAEALQIVAQAAVSRRGMLAFQEAMGTSDFPALFGDILDRQLLGYYSEIQPKYRNYSRIASVRDFRQVKRIAVDGAEGVLAPVAQQGDYPLAKLSDKFYAYQVGKYGRKVPFDWESMINDDLGGLQTTPQRFARAARRSEEKFATSLFVGPNGPLATFYSNANKNIVNVANGASTNNPPLSITGAQDAMIVLANQVDADNEPIEYDMIELVVPPSLEIVANNIINATEILAGGFGQSTTSKGGGAQDQMLRVQNWMKSKLRVSVNYYIPRIATTANGGTSWFMMASSSVGRPALEVGFLKGHESPEMFMKSPNAVRVAGGNVDPMDGDFDTDSIEYKIRHVFGGTQLDPKATVASNGSGS